MEDGMKSFCFRSLPIVIIYLLLFGFFSGCASTGNKQIADVGTVAKIEEGKSTKADVRALVGEPTKVNFRDDNTEVWEYVYKRGQVRPATFIPVVGWFAGGVDATGSTLTILFNKDNIVQKVGSGRISGGGGSLSD
jgi:outer membrane protein assembly factor BamE (lipoprotein component of BamABCDE complex)